MSSSSSTVVIITSPTTQNTYQQLGLGPLPPGTLADAAVAAIEKVLVKQLSTNWPANFAAYDSSQQDQGIMGPWSANRAGSAPACVIQQITSDFNEWGLPNDPGTVSGMGSEITQQIADNGGLTGTFYGKHRLGGAETIYYGVGFGTAAIADNPEVLGIIYVFAAVLGVN